MLQSGTHEHPTSAVTTWDDDMQPFQAMDEMFGQDMTMMPQEPMKDLRPMMSMDLIESDTAYQVHADLPGVNPEDVQISIDNDNLLIQAERKQKHEQSTDTVHRVERSYGKVQRSIRLPKTADQKRVAATHENGVLTITFPKMDTADMPVKGPPSKH